MPDKRTLRINPSTGEAPTPKPGRYYSFLGCFSTDLSSFQEEGAAVSVAQTLANIIFSLVGIISFLYILYGAFILAISQDNPEKINYGKFLLKRAIIGLSISLLAFLIINIIAGKILGLPWFT